MGYCIVSFADHEDGDIIVPAYPRLLVSKQIQTLSLQCLFIFPGGIFSRQILPHHQVLLNGSIHQLPFLYIHNHFWNQYQLSFVIQWREGYWSGDIFPQFILEARDMKKAMVLSTLWKLQLICYLPYLPRLPCKVHRSKDLDSQCLSSLRWTSCRDAIGGKLDPKSWRCIPSCSYLHK